MKRRGLPGQLSQRIWALPVILSLSIWVILLAPYATSILATLPNANPQENEPTPQSEAVIVTPISMLAQIVPATGAPPPPDTPIPADAPPTSTPDPFATPLPTYELEFPTVDPSRLKATEEVDQVATWQALWPTPTSLPTISPDNPNQYAAQKLSFVVTNSAHPDHLGEQLRQAWGYPVWAPDGSLFVASIPVEPQILDGWTDLVLTIFDANGDKLRTLQEAKGYFPVWSPSGKQIAYYNWMDDLQQGTVEIVEVNTGKITQVTTTPKEDVVPILNWLSESELIYFQHHEGGLILFDSLSQQKRLVLHDQRIPTFAINDPEKPMKYITSSPQHRLLAITSGLQSVIINLEADQDQVVNQFEGIVSDSFPISPDGTAIAYVSSTTQKVTIRSINRQGPVVEMPLSNRGQASFLVWSPDGGSLLYMDSEGSHLVNRDGSGLRPLSELPAAVYALNWSTQGNISFIAQVDDSWLVTSLSPVFLQ